MAFMARNRRGQSTLEFVLTMILLMGFVIFFTRFAFFLGYANLVQYATFMAARAYQSGTRDQSAKEENAKNVIRTLLKKGVSGVDERYSIADTDVGGDPRGAQVGDAPEMAGGGRTDDSYSWLQGVRYSFRGKLFVDIFGDKPTAASAPTQSRRGSPGEVQLVSESWLGREPTREECHRELDGRKKFGDIAEPDNGC